ncbi:hypothetical protein [Eubacterium limosum]|uniref:hypothetical protein n=1 Tax=Eubacterium limosum TaxID=1736 RepID=UPI001063AC81|nr:hypothetical protein [Eubacterium limosum]
MVSPFIIGLILTSLVASGAVSGGYKVSPADLSSITEKAQANLQAAGSAAIDQANKLGEAIKSGAESAKIKALASGAVIYAFLQAIQDTLFFKHDVSDIGIPELYSPNFLLAQNADYLVYLSYNTEYFSTQPSFTYLGWEGGAYYQRVNNVKKASYSSYAYGYSIYSVSENKWIKKHTTSINSLYAETLNYYNPGVLGITDYGYYNRMIVSSAEYQLLASILFGATYTDAATQIKDQATITIPTVLPQTIINNINNWDGTSDLVLSPPLPYDIPDDEALVIDPGYVGPDVIDPTDPVDPPAEEGTIVLPWLAALLGLLGLGNPSLEGIEAGVKTAIDKLIEGITATAQDVFDGSKEIFGNITDALTGIDAGIQSGIDALTGSISVPLTNIADFALSVPDFFAIPEGKSIATPIIEQIPTVFPIVDQMNTALNKITVETRPLIIYYPYLDGSTKEINLNWYEPAREQVKHGVGLLFKVVTALACFAMVSNVFGIGIRVGAGQAYTDNNSGGSNSGNSRKKGD